MFRVSYHLISYYVNVHNVNMIVSRLTMTCSDAMKYVDLLYEMNKINQFNSVIIYVIITAQKLYT